MKSLISCVLLGAVLIGIVLLLTGCATSKLDSSFDSGCKVLAEINGKAKLDITCAQDIEKDTDDESKGVMSGKSIGK